MTGRAPLWPWLVVAAGLVTFRTWPYAWWGTLAFDADQAVVGLMAKHIAELRAFPVYQYALSYVLMVSAYLTAPFMWVLGATLFALKLPLVLLNVGVGVGLVVAAVRAGLSPRLAVLLSLPVLMVAPVTNAGLMDALGMTIEPAAFVLALWFLRRSPHAFGVVAAVGFHVREFVAYAIAALLAVDLLCGLFLRRDGWRHWCRAALAGLATTALIAAAARFASVRGPDTWAASSDGNLATLGGAFCFAPAQAWANLVSLPAWYLGQLFGAAPVVLSEVAIQSGVTQGARWAWPGLGGVLLVAAGYVAWRLPRLWARRQEPLPQLAVFLLLVGAQSVCVYAVSRCGPLTLITVRYALLGMFVPTAIGLALWAVAPPAALRRLVGATLLGLATLNAWPHLRIWQEQLTRPAVPNRAQLAAALERDGRRYVRSDYWTAYYVVFLTQERVIVGADTLSRIDAYERLLARHAAEVVRVATAPCGDPTPLVRGYYVCRHQP